MLIKNSLLSISLVCLISLAFSSFAANPEPPKNTLIITQEFKNIVDNSWTNLEFPKDPQPPGLYYMELIEVSGSVGCWGSKKNPYEDGPNKELLTAWQDGVPLEDGNADFRLQYRLAVGNNWVELIEIAPQGAILDTWNPFPLHNAKESIGQTFLALKDFVGVGLATPTWNTANSGCTATLYSSAGQKMSVNEDDKVAIQWGKIKTK